MKRGQLCRLVGPRSSRFRSCDTDTCEGQKPGAFGNPWFGFLPVASAKHRSGSLHSGCWAPVCPIRSNPWTSPLEDGSSVCDEHVCGYALGLTSSLLLDTLPGFAASGIPGLLCKLRVYRVLFHGYLLMWPCGRWCWVPICTSWFPHLCSYAFPTIIR